MNKTVGRRGLGGVGLSLALAALSGCQTWFGGTTLPSGHYLEHPPQYIPPSPPFPLTREAATMQAQEATGIPGAPAPVPAPLAPVQVPAPGPAPVP